MVFLVGSVLSAAVVFFYRTTLDSSKIARLKADSALLHTAIEDRIGTYVAVLRATAALFAVKPDLSRQEFARYVNGLEVENRLSGVQGVGFAKRLRPDEIGAVENQLRASGVPDFEVFPKYPREEYFSIVYLEPLDARNRAALGYDMFSEPVRRKAMERARDQAEAAATGIVTLKQEIEERKQPGFLIYYPVYRGGGIPASVEERRESLIGFAYSPFRTEDLLNGIFREGPRQVEFKVTDDAPPEAPRLMYASGPPTSQDETLNVKTTINVAGRSWTLEVRPGPTFESPLGVGLRTVALVGLLGTALITAVFASEAWRRKAAEDAGRALKERGEEIRRVSEESAKTAALLSSLLENAPIGFAFFDREFRYVRVNNALAGMHSLRADEHVGRSIHDVVPELASRIEPVLRRVFTENIAPSAIEVTGEVIEGGLPRTWLCGFFPVSSGGEVELAGVVITDISERIHMEAELRESERRFRELADAMPQLVWITDSNGTVEYLNRQWHRLGGAGASNPNLVRDWLVNAHPDDAPAARTRWSEALSKGTPFEGEYRFFSAVDADYRWFLCRAVAVHGARGDILRWFGTCTDIQAQKGAEAERDILLANERAARSEVERASRMKDEFLATLSHELRTPINAVLGWAQLLRMPGRSAQDLEEGIETIERNSRVQAQLIEDLLDMSRIVSGKVAFEVSEIAIDAVARGAVESVRHTAATRGVELAIESEATSDLIVLADPARMQQVLWNLLTNAIKFTPAGGRVSVNVKQNGSSCKVSVSDTGQGIAPDFLPFVFDRFRQADASTTRRHGGLGLGLAIVRNLVELHGGTVVAESAGEGRGSTFTVTLPTIAKPAAPALGTGDGFPTDLKPLRDLQVLVVDDEPDALRLVKRIFEESKAKVICAASGAEALKLYKEEKPDVLVCDIGMPEMDGYTLIREIRRIELNLGETVPALALTAFAREEDRERAMDAGYQSYLSKPVDPLDLLSAVAALAATKQAISTRDAARSETA